MSRIVIHLVALSMMFSCTVTQANTWQEVESDALVADYLQAETGKPMGILILGGSGGGKPSDLAAKFEELGHSVMSLAYYKADGLPSELQHIPLEYFDQAISWLIAQPDTDDQKVLVAGWSKGAELALLLASRDPRIAGTIAIAPSSVVWAGILDDWQQIPSSSWSVAGEPLEYVPFTPASHVKGLRDLYTHSLSVVSDIEHVGLPVENISSPVLLLSGGQDNIWPATDMAEQVCARMKLNKLSCVHHDYAEAGHLLDANIQIGGTDEANRAADKDSREKMHEFVQQVQAQ